MLAVLYNARKFILRRVSGHVDFLNGSNSENHIIDINVVIIVTRNTDNTPEFLMSGMT